MSYHAATDPGLGFSLRPPRWLRKAQPGKILQKAAIPLAIGASLFIPGVAPLALTLAKGAGSLAVMGIKKFGGSLAKSTISPGMFSTTMPVPIQATARTLAPGSVATLSPAMTEVSMPTSAAGAAAGAAATAGSAAGAAGAAAAAEGPVEAVQGPKPKGNPLVPVAVVLGLVMLSGGRRGATRGRW